jgi:hypothetical protein
MVDTPNAAEPRGCPTPGACSALSEIERLRATIRAARDNLRDSDDASAYLVLKHSGVSDG